MEMGVKVGKLHLLKDKPGRNQCDKSETVKFSVDKITSNTYAKNIGGDCSVNLEEGSSKNSDVPFSTFEFKSAVLAGQAEP